MKRIGVLMVLLFAMTSQAQPVPEEPAMPQSTNAPPANTTEDQDAKQIAQYTVARRYMTGEDGVEKNPVLGKLLLERAALGGNVYAQAELTNLEIEAQEARRATNTQKIVIYYWNLANRGNDVGEYEMGRRYLTGIDGVTKNPTLGRTLLEKSAMAGNTRARATLAYLNAHATQTRTNQPRQVNEPAGAQTKTDQLEQQIKILQEQVRILEKKLNTPQ